jgi:hypothetical protein
MNVLKEAVYRAVHGEGGLVFVHGEAGIGKTRLVRELGAYARSRGVQVLYGRCPALFRMDGVPPYILWKEVIKDYLETCTPEQLYRVIWLYLVKHFFDCGWLKALVIAIVTIIIFALIAIILGLIGFALITWI